MRVSAGVESCHSSFQTSASGFLYNPNNTPHAPILNVLRKRLVRPLMDSKRLRTPVPPLHLHPPQNANLPNPYPHHHHRNLLHPFRPPNNIVDNPLKRVSNHVRPLLWCLQITPIRHRDVVCVCGEESSVGLSCCFS